MWNNYLLVSADLGEWSECVRALRRVVEMRSSQLAGTGTAGEKEKIKVEEVVDEEVLERMVNAASLPPPSQESESNSSANANSGPSLARPLLSLFSSTLLPSLTPTPRIFRAYARLLISLQPSRWSEALEAEMNAYRLTRAGGGEGGGRIDTSEEWKEAVESVRGTVDVVRGWGARIEADSIIVNGGEDGDGNEKPRAREKPPNWRYTAKSILRTFMGRTKRDWSEEEGWEGLEDLKKELEEE
jgi:hypothetical protein